MEGIAQIDQQVTLWINSLHTPWTDPFWVFMSGIKVWIPMYVVVAALLIWRLGWKNGLIAVGAIAIAFILNEQVNNLIKGIVCRVRPCNDSFMLASGLHVLEEGGGWSFPSGHANNSFGFAVGSALCLKMDRKMNWNWYSAFIFTWAILVGISRIMVARHYLGDVIVGALLGSLMAYVWVIVAHVIINKVIIGRTGMKGRA